MTDRDIDDKLSRAFNADPIGLCVRDLIANDVSKQRLADRLATKLSWPYLFKKNVQNRYRDYTITDSRGK